MKSVTIKILALLLAALMVLPMLAACGDLNYLSLDKLILIYRLKFRF